MGLEHIKELLSINGFRPINTNLEEVTLYDKSAGDRSYLLVLCDFSGYRRLDADQLRHILWRISMNENFVVRGREMLALLVTEDAAYGRSLLQAGFPVWILDCRENSLRIYEDQPADFAGLKAQLENLLGEKGHWRARRSSQFTLCNTILIAINVIMFLAMNLFDKGTSGNRMIRWGAMYTPYMEHPQELYRLITAMFLHFDVSHLASKAYHHRTRHVDYNWLRLRPHRRLAADTQSEVQLLDSCIKTRHNTSSFLFYHKRSVFPDLLRFRIHD